MTQQESVGIETALRLLGLTSIDQEFKALKKRAAETEFKFNPEKAKLKPRPYQVEAIARLRELILGGAPSVALQLPTGAGKTYVIHSYIQTHVPKNAGNVLIIAPSWEIANQHAMTVCQQFKGGAKRVSRLGGTGQLISLFPEFIAGQKGRIVITTSSLFFAREVRLREWLRASLVIIDEGHHGWKKKRLNSVQTFARETGAPAILLTATPPRNMESLPFAAQIKYLDLVPTYLVPCEVVRLHTGQEFKPVIKNGIVSQASRAELSSRETRFEKIVADSIPLIRGQTIYYAGSVAEAMGVVAEFAKRGISAIVVHSKWSAKGDKINSLAIEKFRRGEVQVLVNVQMLAMGFDVPRVETIIVARPVESDTLFTQMVGRGARPSEGKQSFILIDVHDTILKPEVAKIFEHKHIFYQDVDKNLTKPAIILRPAPVLVFRPIDLKGFPYHEGQLDDRMLVTEPAEAETPTNQITDIARAAWRG